MNNKGITLVELMVSLILISIVMVFIFALLVDMKNEDYLSSSKSEDALNRTEIIHLIENDFINYKLSNVSQDTCPSGANFCLKFNFYNNPEKKLYFFDDHLVYDNEAFYLSIGSFEVDKTEFCYTKNVPTDPDAKNSYAYFNLTVPVTHDATVNRKTTIDLSYLNTKYDSTFNVDDSFNINGNQIIPCKEKEI